MSAMLPTSKDSHASSKLRVSANMQNYLTVLCKALRPGQLRMPGQLRILNVENEATLQAVTLDLASSYAV